MKYEGLGYLLGRRRVLALMAGLISTPKVFAQTAPLASSTTPFAPVVPGYALRFPRDHGSHPEFRLEWWYVTGWLTGSGARPLGYQITFFRARPSRRTDNPSAFAPHQMLIAHAAISDPARGRLQHDQRAARAAFGIAGAAQGRTEVWIDDWSLRQSNARYTAAIVARDFRLDLVLTAAQPPLLQGAAGLSRKGPRPESASYYYSVPQLDTSGTVIRNGKAERVHGASWLDHEWSSSYLDERAVGWDWIGINLEGGGALMAFQIRDARGEAFWAGGAHRGTDGQRLVFARESVRFTPLRHWRSPRTGTNYPISWRVRAGDREIDLDPLLDDQENDTRATTGAIYWEGAVRALHAGQPVGRGYLELTGYWRRLQL
jgi:predicted secreted hydrolase